KKIALVEREHVVGGNGVNWGAIPSKTLRESALFVRSLTKRKLEGIACRIDGEISIADFMHRKQQVVQREIDLINRSLENWAVDIISGHGRLVDPKTVDVKSIDGTSTQRITGDKIIIATGTDPFHPSDIDFDDDVVFDSTTILGLPRMPRSIVVLGAGVIGLEYAAIFSALGLRVTQIDARDQLLPYLDKEISRTLKRELKDLGVHFILSDSYKKVEKIAAKTEGGAPSIVLQTKKGSTIEADILLYAAGRSGNTKDLGLENLDIQPDSRGLLKVNEFYQTTHPDIYAVGDVIGYPALASTSMEQGRQAARHALGLLEDKPKSAKELPFVIYTIPEVAYIGESEESLKEKGTAYLVGRGLYEKNPRGQITGDTGGLMKLLFDAESLQILGAHIVGRNASELIHTGQAFLNHQATAWEISESLYNYPTLSDLYRHAAIEAIAASNRRQE
ncbi:Si-specific NAD(P)(+) transhydrogenase, partial [Myxococcota bacterium]|nr:Si-specific NAD(P)(+) transhydrogenase [Myxococcota bacterium]